MIQKIREWFFRLFTGLSFTEFILGSTETARFDANIKDLQSAYTDLLTEWLTLQESISNLYKALSSLNEAVNKINQIQQSHETAIQQLIQLGQIHNENYADLVKKIQQSDQISFTSHTKPNKPD